MHLGREEHGHGGRGSVDGRRGEDCGGGQGAYEKVAEEHGRCDEAYPAKFWGQLEHVQADGAVGEGIVKPFLNALFPHLQPVSVEQYVAAFWA